LAQDVTYSLSPDGTNSFHFLSPIQPSSPIKTAWQPIQPPKVVHVQFYPTGVVVRSFAVDGGHEKIRAERIYGQPGRVFADHYNRSVPVIDRHLFYRIPSDAQGQESFNHLIDADGEILRLVA